MRTRVSLYLYYLMPFCLVVFAIVLTPLAYSFYLSFFKYNLAQLYLGMKFVGFSNYLEALSDPDVISASKATIIYVFLSLLGELFIGITLALTLNRKLRGTAIFRVLVLLPMMLTPAAVGLVWKFFYSYTGLVNFTLELLGFQAVNWFDERNALLSVIIVSIWQHYPLAFLVILAGLQTIPQNIIEAAKIDGASPFQIFINISFPLLRSLIIVILVIRTINLLRYVDLIFTLTHGGPGTATETFSFLIYKKGFELFNMGYGSALSYLLIFLSILITWLYLRLVKAE